MTEKRRVSMSDGSVWEKEYDSNGKLMSTTQLTCQGHCATCNVHKMDEKGRTLICRNTGKSREQWR